MRPRSSLLHWILPLILIVLFSSPVHTQTAGRSIPKASASADGRPSTSEKKQYLNYRLEEGYFECEISNKWIDIRDERDDRRVRVYGMVLVLKNSQPGIKPFISINYYAPDNHYFSSADHYLKIQFKPPLVKLEGEKISEIQEVVVNGNKARQFVRDTFDFWPPHSMDTKEISVREEYTVLEAEEGFFVLRYSAPDNQFTSYRPDYQHILDTFKPFPVDRQ